MTTLALEVRPLARVGPMEFSRRFRELVAGELQRNVANKLGFTGSRVSQIMRGEKPSREFVERVIAVYELDREEWLGYAGFGLKADPVDERRDIARQAAEEAVRLLLERSTARSGEDLYWDAIRRRRDKLAPEGIRILLPTHNDEGFNWEALTPEKAEEMVDEIERISRKYAQQE